MGERFMIFQKVVNLFEMANVRPDETGLKMVIYISPRMGVKHGPRIKVSTFYGEKIYKGNYCKLFGKRYFSITIEDEPRVIGKTGDIKLEDVKKACQFVQENKIILLKLWYDEISPTTAVQGFSKV